MILKVPGAIGYALILAAMLLRSYRVLDSVLILGIIALAGLIGIGIAENKSGVRHWVVRYTDYAPLAILGFIYGVQINNNLPSALTAICIIPASVISALAAAKLAKTKKYRTHRRLEDTLPDPPKEDYKYK